MNFFCVFLILILFLQYFSLLYFPTENVFIGAVLSINDCIYLRPSCGDG